MGPGICTLANLDKGMHLFELSLLALLHIQFTESTWTCILYNTHFLQIHTG